MQPDQQLAVLGSFDSEDFFASEEICSAQDDMAKSNDMAIGIDNGHLRFIAKLWCEQT